MRYEKGHGKLYRRRKNGKEVGNYKFKFGGVEVNTKKRDRKAAQQWRNEFLAEAQNSQTPANDRGVTVGDLLDYLRDRYLDRRDAAQGASAQRRKQQSLARLRAQSKRIRARFGAIPADDLRPDQITAYARSRIASEERPARATVNRELETLRAALRLGDRMRRLKRAPVEVEMLAVSNTRQGFLEHDEYERLLQCFDRCDHWRAHSMAVRLMTVIAYHTGWRATPILELRWDQIDFEQKLIRPPAEQAGNKSVGGASFEFGELHEELVAALRVHSEHFEGVPWVLHNAGSPIKTYRYAWNRATQLAGLEGLLFHDLRRTAARNMIRAGVPEAQVMKQMGHKTRSTHDRYQIISAADIREAGKRLNAYLEAKREETAKLAAESIN